LNKKLIALVVAASSSGVLGGMAFSGAHAQDVPTPVGTVTASGDPTTSSGQVIVQGNGTAPGPVGSGYVGVTSANGGEVVGCANGTYDNGAPDSNNNPTAKDNHNRIAGIPPTQADLAGLQNAGSSSCTPSH
jgi:hypothetical protein